MIRIATIGTSKITESLLEALAARDDAAFVGTLSRDSGRADAFTRAHGGERGFSSIGELAAAGDVDAVYIGSPNACHAEQALACIAGGKHVLVEKPFAANAREARAVFDAADEAGVVALEAMRPLHDPAFFACRDAMGRLGRVRRATLRFGKYSSRYDEVLAGRRTNIFDCAMASGALMDIGVYTVEPALALFGAPERVLAAPVLLDAPTRALTHGAIDGAGVISLLYPDKAVTLHYSKITADLAGSQIEGEAGTLAIDEISTPTRARIEMRVAGSASAAAKGYSGNETAGEDLALPACENSMGYELADFLGAVAAVRSGGVAPGSAPAGPLGAVGAYRDVTLASLAVMDEARRQMGVAFPADAG